MFYGKSLQSSAQFLSEKNEGVAFLTKCQDPKNTGVLRVTLGCLWWALMLGLSL